MQSQRNHVFSNVTSDFTRVRDEVEDDKRVGRPCSSKTDYNISKNDDTVRKDRQPSFRTTAEMIMLSNNIIYKCQQYRNNELEKSDQTE